MAMQLWIIVLYLLPFFHLSNGDQNNASPTRPKTFIVSVQHDLIPSNFATVGDWHKRILAGISPPPKLLYSYKTAFHGFAASLTPEQIKHLSSHPAVVDVFEDRLVQLHTTRSPQFLGLSYNNTRAGGLVKDSDQGSNVVIGFLDSGIFPERRSFSDHDLPPVPATWKGECDGGANFSKSLCNKKLVGARYFNIGIKALMEKDVNDSARDEDGHGTHTASTAAGRAVSNASYSGLASGEAIGIAPKARIAVYRVCYSNYCADSDIIAAMDKAIEDGVNILSLSIGRDDDGMHYFSSDSIAICAFTAVQKGIFVSASAGNEGPGFGTLSNTAPWLTVVGAGTIDRNFPADLNLKTGETLTGVSLYDGNALHGFYPLELEENKEILPASRSEIVGKPITVLVKKYGDDGSYHPDSMVGWVYGNTATSGEGLIPTNFSFAAVQIPYSATKKLLSYLNSSGDPRGALTFHHTVTGVSPAPVVASFSSRGPNPEPKFILKPDIIAPGLGILAAWADTRDLEFFIQSGTSMSCSHVSGIAAMLKAVHPNWTPAMIQSALMTTAYLRDQNSKPLLDQFSNKEATIWATGAGHVDPERANDPGLVYDVKAEDYIDYLCAIRSYTDGEISKIAKRKVSCSGRTMKPWDLNYPAVVVDSDGASELDVVVKRAVTYVGKEAPSTYKAKLRNPKGAAVTVNPPVLVFKREGETQRFEIRLKGKKNGSSWFETGSLVWSDDIHIVNSPIVVQWGRPAR